MRVLYCFVAAFAATVFGQDPTVTIGVTEPVTFIDLNEKKIVSVRDQDVTMACHVENLPQQAMVRWQWIYQLESGIVQTQKVSQDTAVEDNTKFSIEKPTVYTWRLRIKSIQVSDEGNYTCFVQTTRENKKFDNRTIQVKVPPYLNPEKTSPDTTLREGEDFELTCSASGRPNPTVEWTRLGGALLPIGEEKFYGSILKIRTVRAEHRGTYRCTAFNSVGKVSRDINLAVKFKPIVKTDGDSDAIVYQAVGYRTELQCLAEANPFPKEEQIKWVKDSTSISSSVGRQEVRLIRGAFGRLTYELIIHGVEKRDYGTYTCMVENSEGETTHKVVLKETEAPQASIKLGRVITGAESRQVGGGSHVFLSLATIATCLITALLHL